MNSAVLLPVFIRIFPDTTRDFQMYFISSERKK